MPDINARIDTLASNIQKVRDSRSALGIDKSGELIRLNFKGKIARALVDIGIAREGKWGSRIVTALVGKESFELLCKSPKTRLQNSIRNVAVLVKQLETQDLDSDLSNLVKDKIDTMMHAKSFSLTADGLKRLHTVIRDEIIPQRLECREALVETLECEEPTPMMEDATHRGVALAIAALERNMEAGATPYLPAERLIADYHTVPAVETEGHSGEAETVEIATRTMGHSGPVDESLAREVCGRHHDGYVIKRDIWDANKILGELKMAELHVRDTANSEVIKLNTQCDTLRHKIENEGAEASPDEVAEWELQLHGLESKIKNVEQELEGEIKEKVADLKNDLLTVLKGSLKEKEALAKFPESEIKTVSPEPREPKNSAGNLKSALKNKETSATEGAKPKARRRIQFGGTEVKDIGKSYTDVGFEVNDENRSEWVATIMEAFDENEKASGGKNTQEIYEIARALEQRVKRGKADQQMLKTISLLRTHPVFLKADNFDALVINLTAASAEQRQFSDKFPDEAKQNYRKHSDDFRQLAQQKIDEADNLLKYSQAYEDVLEKFAEDPETRKAQLTQINEQFNFKDYYETYKNVSAGGDAQTDTTHEMFLEEVQSTAKQLEKQAGRVLSVLNQSKLFVDISVTLSAS